MERPTSSDTMPKRDHERDLELDKKIEALRRKNEALMKRYKEVEEDKKRAEEEGMALQSRKGKADDLTITISKSTSESRVVVTKPFSGGSPSGRGQQETGPDRPGEAPPQGAGRNHRKQLTVTMAGKKGKRVVSERPDRRPGPPADVKSPTDDGQARRVESAGKGKQQQQHPHTSKRDTETQEESESLQASTTDLHIPTSKEEQEEYLRWKKEREQIDRERVARHKNAKGQWRRAWDMDKSESMFLDKSLPDRDWGSSSRGRHAKRGQGRAGADSRGHEKRGKDKGSKNVLVMSSKAKGKDRLTGRARRWQANEEGEHFQMSDTTLEEFLEELDALTDTEPEDQKEQERKTKLWSGPDLTSTCEEGIESTASVILREDNLAPGKAESSSPRGSEKKVRFSEELIQVAHMRRPTGSQESASSEPKNLSSLKASSPKKYKHELERPQQPLESAKQEYSSDQDQGGGPYDSPVAQQQPADTECTKKDSTTPTAPSYPPAVNGNASIQESSDQPVELVKCNISNTNAEELIDSGLSVLSLESGETHATHSTSSDKAREHGKIV